MWVADEAGHGRDKGNLVPISLDGAQPPIGFRQLQVIDFRAWAGKPDGPEFSALAKAIKSKISAAPAAAPEGAALETTAQLTERAAAPIRPKALATALIGVAALAGAAALVLWPRSPIGELSVSAESSITVTPFRYSGQSDWLDELSGGVTQSIRHHLRLAGFTIIGYDFPSGAPDGELMRLADALNPDFILDGAVTELGADLLFNIQLIDKRSKRAVLSIEHSEASRADLEIVDRVIALVMGKVKPETSLASGLGGGSAAAGAVASDIHDKASARFYEALHLIDIGNRDDLERAASALADVVESDPDNGEAQAALAYAIASSDRYRSDRVRRAEAESAAAKARAALANPSDADLAEAVIAYVYDERAVRYPRAKSHLEAALSADPGNIKALKWMSNVAFQEGDYEAALRYSEASLALSPYYRAAIGNEASSLLMLGRRDEARTTLDQALARFADWGWGLRFRASLALTEGDLIAVVEKVRAAARLEDLDESALLLSIAYANLGRAAAAEREIDAAAGESGAWEAYKKRIIAGDIDAAADHLSQLTIDANAPNRTTTLTASGFLKFYRGDYDAAKIDCGAAIAPDQPASPGPTPPSLAEVCIALAEARLGSPSRARGALARLEASMPQAANAYRPYWLESQSAALFTAIGEKEKAIAILDDMIASGWRTPNTALCRHCVHLAVDDSAGVFASLAPDPEFIRLMTEVRSDLQRQDSELKRRGL